MGKTITILLLLTIVFCCCTNQDKENLAPFEVYCEMVSNDAKPLALHYPMDGEEVDQLWSTFLQIAQKHDVQLYREEDFPPTLLFPSESITGKTIIVVWKGDRLKQYQQWKADIIQNDTDPEGYARRLGRLLGYEPSGINALLSKKSDYRALASFGIASQVTHLYYPDLQEARAFYKATLGLHESDSLIFQIGADSFIQLHSFDDVHPEGQPKSTAIALLTDQLPDWYEYIRRANIPIKYTYKPRDGGPHDGFVAIDPGGYLLEFEQFKQHPENELLMAVLGKAKKISTSINNMNFYGSITWTYHQDLLKMQNFYQEVLGYQLVADQGWTKIYQTSKSGFIGLVDERRGMQDYADNKAIEVEWKLLANGFSDYATRNWKSLDFDQQRFTGPEKYIYRIESPR